MRYLYTMVAALGLLLLGTMPAAAHHAVPVLPEPEVGECGETTLQADLPAEPHGSYANAALVVQAGGEQEVAELGEPITVGPFEADTEVRYRVWGGGERGYDSPALSDLDSLVAYLGDNPGGELDVDAPGVAWHTVEVEGCPPPPEPCEWDDELTVEDEGCVEPEPEPTEDPTSEPSAEPSAEETTPASEDGTTPAATQETLPDTGVSPLLMAGLGLALVLAGGAAMLRRRTE